MVDDAGIGCGVVLVDVKLPSMDDLVDCPAIVQFSQMGTVITMTDHRQGVV